MTFDRVLEIIRIILELHSQIRSLVPMRILIMRIIAASKKCGLFWSRFDLRPNNADIIRIIELVNGVLYSDIYLVILVINLLKSPEQRWSIWEMRVLGYSKKSS